MTKVYKTLMFFILCGAIPSYPQRKNTLEQLLDAVQEGNKKQMEQLINKGVDVNQANVEGETPLIVAIANRKKDIVELLLSHGANIFAQSTIWGHTVSPVDIAQLTGDEDILDLLLSHKPVQSLVQPEKSPSITTSFRPVRIPRKTWRPLRHSFM